MADQNPNNDFKSTMENLNNTPDATGQYTQQDIEQNKVMAALGYVLFLIPMLAAKDSPFAQFHANQGLVFLIMAIVVNVIGAIVSIIPLLGWIVYMVLELVVLIFFILGLVNALQGKAKQLPLIGGIKILK